MPNRLADAVSPYLRSHADNPVDWWQWGADAFAEATARDVPVLVSIGYSTCHWCHVMARESFSDPVLAAHLNANFVAIKVDREEYPDVDATYLAAAGAFTGNLGWPLNVFVTPDGRCFYAGTYFPPQPVQGHPAFRQVLDAVTEAWRDRRDEVQSTAAAIVSALGAAAAPVTSSLPAASDWVTVTQGLVGFEDASFGGFGGAPKFPVAPVQLLLLDRAAADGDDAADAAALAARNLASMAASDLRDEVEGGFFRYSTMRDWSDPHYERMLYDNAQLLLAYARVEGGRPIAEGIARFLGSVMGLGGSAHGGSVSRGSAAGGFASAQDSESTVDGVRVEGGYYALDAAGRATQHPPALDLKVLTGWNGLAIDALARSGVLLDRADWITLARDAADYLLAHHLRSDGSLARASIDGRVSAARATLEDYGMFAAALLRLALACGDVRYATAAKLLVDSCLLGDSFAVPGGADPVLVAHGLALEVDPSEGAYPSGITAMAAAGLLLFQLTADDRYRRAARSAVAQFAEQAVARPIAFGASLSVMTALDSPVRQLVVVTADAGVASRAHGSGVTDDSTGLASAVRSFDRPGAIATIVTMAQARAFADAGFELFAGRVAVGGLATAYLCDDFVCRLPVTSVEELPL